MTKQCPACGKEKPREEFYKNKGRADGLASVCTPCGRAYQADSLRRNPECGKVAAAKWRSTPSGRITNLLQGARARATASGIPCTITPEWVAAGIASGRCAVTRIPFCFEKDGRGSGFKNPFIPSLDQILPNRGYTPENTQVVVWTYNAAKGAGTHSDVMKLAKALCNVQ